MLISIYIIMNHIDSYESCIGIAMNVFTLLNIVTLCVGVEIVYLYSTDVEESVLIVFDRNSNKTCQSM